MSSAAVTPDPAGSHSPLDRLGGRRRRSASLAAVLAAALIATACSGGDTTTAGAPDTPTAPESPRTLTLLTHDSFDVSTDVLAAFMAETGVRVEVVPLGDTGSALNRVILTADDPEGDLLFGVDNTFLSRALDADLFLPYRSPLLDRVDAALVPDDDRVTPVSFGDVCVNYDIAWFEAAQLAPPTTLTDLADPAYAGLLVVQNPATSSPGLAFLLGTIERLGEEAAFALWADLRANDVLVADGWSDAYYGAFTHAGGGDRPLVVSYASSPPAEVLFAVEPTDVAPTAVLVDTCFRQVEYVGILATSPRADDARLLIDFLLSDTFQADMPLTMFVYPVRPDVALPDVFTAHSLLPEVSTSMDPDRIEAGREGWITRFTSTVLR
jgi:thiamine transport system substrate-binding protein